MPPTAAESPAPAILVDANLVMWAHHRQFPHHEPARQWWARTLSDTPVVGIPWPTILAFLRLSTHPRILERPLMMDAAWDVVTGWLARATVRCPVPTDRHSALLASLLSATRVTANHTSDAHLAALAIEWGLELHSADSDFARYPNLRWRDPLVA